MPRRGSSSPPLLSLPLLIISLPIIAFLLLFFVVPYFLSLTTHKIKPAHTVKSSWDSLNILLVLFAILCGVFARRNDDGSSTTNKDAPHTNVNHHGRTLERHAVSDTHWFVDQFSSDQKTDGPNNYPFGKAATGTGRLKRSSSSYPDLRQESLWEMGDDRFRFFDDFEINKYHRSPIYHGGNRSDDSNVKEIPIDTSVLRSSLPSPSPPPPPKSTAPPPPPPPPPPQTTTSNRKTKRTHRTVSRKSEKVSEKDNEFTEIKAPPPTPPPPPPPPPRLATPTPSEKKQLKIERIKSNATKEIKMVFASLYRKRKKKQKTRILPDETPQSPIEPPSFTRPPPSPPPPPPPPPLPSMFQSLFRKGSSKSKRIHSFSASVPQPPPPPPAPPSRRSSKHKNQAAPPPPPPPPPPSAPPPEPRRSRKSTSKGRPPLPTRVNNLHDENFNSGGQSPLIPMPPPPPPPPFKVPGFRFVRRGDFVKVQSAHSSRCGSPELEDVDWESNEAVKVMDGGDGIGGGSGFCPSPDVNIKADTFIARRRDEWRLEKINSLREKRDVGLGPIKF